MSKHCGFASVAYNFALSSFTAGREVGEWRSCYDLKNKKIAKALSDSALGGFLSKLEYKADRHKVEIVKAGSFFASSKTCSRCGHKKQDLTLSDRTYHCSECDLRIDRDLNAAINLCPS